MGPLIATLFARMDSSTCSGRGVPYLSMTSAPASWTSQSNSTPVASSTRRVASDSSGPTPSPGMNVTRWTMNPLLHVMRGPAGPPRLEEPPERAVVVATAPRTHSSRLGARNGGIAAAKGPAGSGGPVVDDHDRLDQHVLPGLALGVPERPEEAEDRDRDGAQREPDDRAAEPPALADRQPGVHVHQPDADHALADGGADGALPGAQVPELSDEADDEEDGDAEEQHR